MASRDRATAASMIHFVSISGGKDSTATACLALERAHRRPMELRFIFADTGNEHPLTLEHVAYIGRTLGITIETVRADFSHRFEARRKAMLRDWVKELKRKQHSSACREACSDLAYAEKALIREECNCPVKVSPALPEQLVRRAADLMTPSGNPFLDMAMIHGRFPGSQSRFCTEELKLQPMEEIKDRVRIGDNASGIVEWIGERADESAARRSKPGIEVVRCSWRAPAILYRPIHQWGVPEVFAIAKRHGLKPNPLYLMGMGRVGCMPCIMAQKDELRQIGLRFPEQIDRLEEWEKIVGSVARHAYSRLMADEAAEMVSSFMPADRVPQDRHGHTRATIRRVIEWAQTSRGGRNLDLLTALDGLEMADEPSRCHSRYNLCE